MAAESGLTRLVKAAALAIATLFVVPALISFFLKVRLIGRNRALHGSTQALALLPGIPGRYLRVAFLKRVLEACDSSATVEFGTIFSQSGAQLGRNAYVGPGCHLGMAIVEDDVLIAAGVHIPSGRETHGTARLDIPIREQPGRLVPVRIGTGSWIGSASVIMADIGVHSIVAAGSVVTQPVPPYSVVAGVPARVIRDRRAAIADGAGSVDHPATRSAG